MLRTSGALLNVLPSRRAEDNRGLRYGPGDNRAGSYDSVWADRAPLQDDGPRTDMRVSPYPHVSSEHGTACNVRMVADITIMLNDGARVDDDILTERRVSPNGCRKENLRSCAQARRGGDNGRWMANRERFETCRTGAFK